ncbi:MAG: rhomboid family intramembrane serine protease [Anaerolineaceae bacterium]|nr:rhomboid family intramembrane serine protease [Anaerolineaceae bacterium]
MNDDNLAPKPERQHPLYNTQPPQPPTPPVEQAAPPTPRSRVVIGRVRPLVTYALILINVAVFALGSVSAENSWSMLAWGGNQPQQIFQAGEFYRLFTAMFLHASIYTPSGGWALANSAHIIFNMYILYAVGVGLEPLFGHVRFALVYLLGGLTGSVLSALLGPWDGFSIGASGAVFAILGGEFIFLYHHRAMMGAAGAARRRNLINLAVINLVFGLLSNVSGSQMQIDNWGHIGGALGGVILAWFISPIYKLHQNPLDPSAVIARDTNPWQEKLVVIGAFAVGLVVLLIIGANTLG